MRRTLIAAGGGLPNGCILRLRHSDGLGLELFPFHLVRAVWNDVANKQPSVDCIPGLRPRYEAMPISGRHVMFGDSHIRLMDWSELYIQRQRSPIEAFPATQSIYVVAHRTHIGGEAQEGIRHGGSKRPPRRARSGSSHTRL